MQRSLCRRVSNGVAKSDGYFALSYDRIDNSRKIADSIISVSRHAIAKGIPFVFVATLYKGEMQDFTYPPGVDDFTAENADDINTKLKASGRTP